MKKKTLIFCMVISILLLSLILIACSSDSKQNYSWDAEMNGYVVTSMYVGEENGKTVTIPETYDDGVHGTANVVGIGSNAFSGLGKPKYIVLPKTIQDIAANAFSGIDLGNIATTYVSSNTGLNLIGYDEKFDAGFPGQYKEDQLKSQVFWCIETQCDSSQIHVFPGMNVETVGKIKLSRNLASLDIPAEFIYKIDSENQADWGTDNEYFEKKNFKLEITINSGTSIPANAFNNLTPLINKTITLAETIEEIGKSAFEYSSVEANQKNRVIYEGDISQWCSIKFEDATANPLAGCTGEMFTYKVNGKYHTVGKTLNINVNSGNKFKIGNYAFYGLDYYDNENNSLEIIIGKDVESIGNNPFDDIHRIFEKEKDGDTEYSSASARFNVYYAGDVDNWCQINFANGSSNPLYAADGLYLPVNGYFTKVTEAKVNVDVKDYAFSGYKHLKHLTINEGCKSIGAHAFENCSGLEDEPNLNFAVEGTENLTHMGEAAFRGCDGAIAERTHFVGNKTYKYAVIGTWIIGPFDNAQSANLEELSLEARGIADGAFKGFNTLNSLILGEQVKYVGSNAFGNCTNLQTIQIECQEIQVDDKAFSGSNGIRTAKIPISVIDKFSKAMLQSVTLYGDDWLGNGSVPTNAFRGCKNLQYVTIPDYFTEIGNNAFYACEGLERVSTLSKQKTGDLSDCQMQRIGDNAFRGCQNLGEISIPASVTEIGENAFYGCNNIYYASVSAFALTHLPKEQLTWLTIIGNEIPDFAFDGCDNLSLVTIGNDISTICPQAFENLPNLFVIMVENDNQYFKMGQDLGVLYSKDGGTLIKYPVGLDTVTELMLPDGVTKISDYAFSGASYLTSITIPQAVSTIGEHAFSGCTSLEQINITDSVETIGENAFEGCEKVIKYDSQGIGYVNNWVVSYRQDIKSDITVDQQIKGFIDGALSDWRFNEFICHSDVNNVVEYVKNNITADCLAYYENHVWHTRTTGVYDFSFDNGECYLHAVNAESETALLPVNGYIYNGTDFVNVSHYGINKIIFSPNVKTVMIALNSDIDIAAGAFDGNDGIEQIVIEGNGSTASELCIVDGSLYQITDNDRVLIWQKP